MHDCVTMDKDLKLATDWDIDVSAYDTPLTTDAEQIVQRVRQRLQVFRGEWFLDVRAGVPWLQDILVHTPRLNYVEALLKAEIVGTPGIVEITQFSMEYSAGNRTLEVAFKARTETGETVAVSVEV